MAEEIFSGYESPQSDIKRQKLLECIITENSKLYLGKVCNEEQLKKLNDEEALSVFHRFTGYRFGRKHRFYRLRNFHLFDMIKDKN